jgi:hypothetical protein
MESKNISLIHMLTKIAWYEKINQIKGTIKIDSSQGFPVNDFEMN